MAIEKKPLAYRKDYLIVLKVGGDKMNDSVVWTIAGVLAIVAFDYVHLVIK